MNLIYEHYSLPDHSEDVYQHTTHELASMNWLSKVKELQIDAYGPNECPDLPYWMCL